MEGRDDDGVGAAAERLSIEGRLWRAALLTGMGSEARPLARALASVVETGAGRSCLEAGSPIQLTVDAPGPAGLRVGVRMGAAFDPTRLAGLVPGPAIAAIRDKLAPLPAATHATLGAWLFWTAARQSVFVDLRDAAPAEALRRLDAVLDDDERARLERVRPPALLARPWALRIEAEGPTITRVHVHWLLDRSGSVRELVDAMSPGRWPDAERLLAKLVRDPSRSGRFVVATPLDHMSTPALRLSSTGVALVPEDDAKQRAMARLAAELGGRRDHVEALWSLCRSESPPRWRVGRAVELRLADTPRVRWFMTPWVLPTAPAEQEPDD